MARRYNMVINQGETYRLRVPILDANENAADTTDVVVRGQMRTGTADPVVLYTWSAADDNVTIENGQGILSVSAAVSAAWTFRHAVYDVELVDAGDVTRLLEGLVTVKPETTRL